MTRRTLYAAVLAVLLAVVAAALVVDLLTAYGDPPPVWPQVHRPCDPAPCTLQVVHPEDLDR